MSDTPAVRYESADHVATLTLNRAETRNALRPDVMSALTTALTRADSDPDVRVIVLTGAGPVFCAGGDLAGMQGDVQALGAYEQGRQYVDLFSQLWHLRTPLLAAVNGHAIGGGLGLVALADLAVAVDTARFGTPDNTIGLSPMMLAPLLLRSLPRKVALELLYLGSRLDAARACEVGLINAAVPSTEFESTIIRYAERLTRVSTTAVRLGREAVQLQDSLTMDQALNYLNAMFSLNVAGEDAQEGIAAFFEKRPPRWLD